MVASTSSSVGMTRAMSFGQPLSKRYDYTPPTWAQGKFTNPPQHGRLHLAHLPTPLYQWSPSSVQQPQPVSSSTEPKSAFFQRLAELDITLYIKRDDMTGGCETGGNKIRKLEFLLADAIGQDRQDVVTIGGEQSNHCRATAAACRMVGLRPHLILRTARADAIQERQQHGDDAESKTNGGIGYTGNILFDRLVGSSIYTCTPGEYGRLGSSQLVSRVCQHVEEGNSSSDDKATVYGIPVGGSNGMGTWGYVDAVEELLVQWKEIDAQPSLDHVVFACGSGGTAAGITLGMALAHEDDDDDDAKGKGKAPIVHAMGVSDSPDYFYNHVAEIADEMGLLMNEEKMETYIRNHMVVHQGKGLGYAASTSDELEFISSLALETGVVLDPVYSGKALYHFVSTVLDGDDAEQYRGSNILFWHTGGALGMFDKGEELLSTMDRISHVHRLDVYGKGGPRTVDISQKN